MMADYADDPLRKAALCHEYLIARMDEVQQLSRTRAHAIRQAHAAGFSWQQIADHLGVTRSAVSRFAKEVTQ